MMTLAIMQSASAQMPNDVTVTHRRSAADNQLAAEEGRNCSRYLCGLPVFAL